MSGSTLTPVMHLAANNVRDTDTSWDSFLAPKKREAAFRRQVSVLHRQFCDCEDYKSHFSWPITPDKEEPEQPDGPDTEAEGGDAVSDITIIESGEGMVGDAEVCSR